LTGGAPARVVTLAQTYVLIQVEEPGRYRLAVRYSPYWKVTGACVFRGKDGMVQLMARRRGYLMLRFKVDTGRALATMVGRGPAECLSP
jgi:hypothetical protein